MGQPKKRPYRTAKLRVASPSSALDYYWNKNIRCSRTYGLDKILEYKRVGELDLTSKIIHVAKKDYEGKRQTGSHTPK